MESIWVHPNMGACIYHASYVRLARPEQDKDVGEEGEWFRSAQLTMATPPAVCVRNKLVNVNGTATPIDYSFLDEGTLITEIYIYKNDDGDGTVEFRCHPDDDFASVRNGVTLKVSFDPLACPDRIPEIRSDSSATALIITSIIE